MKAEPLDLIRIFQGDIRYVVPIFQRRYVWSQEDQWEGLWEDLTDAVGAYRRSEQLKEMEPQAPVVVPTHFLGAIVLDEAFAGTGRIDSSLVIDGQQRLTTLQVILAALRSVAEETGDEKQARLVARLLGNDPDLVDEPAAQYKVWPSKKDRDAFCAVIAGQPKAHPESRISQAYVYFRNQIAIWAAEEPGSAIADFAETVRRYVRVVVIDLEEGDNAQVIFESLNYGGEELLATDLVKNHVFQRAEREHEDVEALYENYWQPFEEQHWSEKIRQGRLYRPRAEIFLMHWLKMKLVEEVNAHRLFIGFRQVLDSPGLSTGPTQTIKELASDRDIYTSFDSQPPGSIERDFFERIAVLDVTTHLPLALALFRQPEETLTADRRRRALRAIESWMVRRLLCRLPTKNYNRIFLDLIELIDAEPDLADDVIVGHLEGLDGESQRWPTDNDLDAVVPTVRFYGWLTQARVVMVLKAVENHWRAAMSEERLGASTLTIEHVMPRSWAEFWPLPEEPTTDRIAERDAAVQTLGNLTLVTSKLNSSMSHSAWQTKQNALKEHGVLLLNSRMVKQNPDAWDEQRITARSATLLDAFKQIWPRQESKVEAASVVPSEADRLLIVQPAAGSGNMDSEPLTGTADQQDEAVGQAEDGVSTNAATRSVIRDQLQQGLTPDQVYNASGKKQTAWLIAIEEEARLAQEHNAFPPTPESVVALRDERKLRWARIAARTFGDAGRVSEVRALYDQARGAGASQRSYTGRGRRFPEMDT